jgi:hypothetical protein
MRILAIDPGNEQSAWCKLVDGAPAGAAKAGNAEVLHALRSGALSGDLLAIEMIASYGMPVGREVFETCLWIGRFLEAWDARGGKHRLVYRREVKIFLCESNRANDANIRAALIDRFGPGREVAIGTKRSPGPLYGMKGDTWSALGVALTADGGRTTAPLFRERVAKATATEGAAF